MKKYPFLAKNYFQHGGKKGFHRRTLMVPWLFLQLCVSPFAAVTPLAAEQGGKEDMSALASPACMGRDRESQLQHQTFPAAAEALTRDLFCQLCYGDVISRREKIKDSWGLSHKNQFCSSGTFVLSTCSFIDL